MKDFATGTVLFAANMLVEIGDGQHKELVAKVLITLRKSFLMKQSLMTLYKRLTFYCQY